MSEEESKSKKDEFDYYRRDFLNQEGHETVAFILAQIGGDEEYRDDNI